jgi:adenosylhomocysteine nucleosidase
MSDGATVGIVTAMEAEVQPLVRNWQRVTRQCGATRYRFFENGNTVVLAGGIGHAAGMRAAEAMISCYAPDWLIAAGLAGGLRPDWAPPKTMIAARVIDEETGREFETAHGRGTVVSSRTIAGAEKKRELAQRFAADIVDMEGAAVGAVATSNGIPFLAVKAVSDELDFDLPPLQQYVDEQGRFQTVRFTTHAAFHPQWWPMIAALKRKTDAAARELAGILKQVIAEHAQRQNPACLLSQR